jgi:hypothetical protein
VNLAIEEDTIASLAAQIPHCLLVGAVKGCDQEFPIPQNHGFGFRGCCFCGCCSCGVWGFPLFAATATPDKRSSIVVAVDRQVLAFVFDSSCSVFDFR